MDVRFMMEAIRLSAENVDKMDGGPFGAVVVKNGKIVGRSHNMVLKNNDATAHGEVSAIRDAGKNLKTYDLSGCDLYTSCEPCPMCLMAATWANIANIYYAADRKDAAAAGFRDEWMYDKLKKSVKTGIQIKECQTEAAKVMKLWVKSRNKVMY